MSANNFKDSVADDKITFRMAAEIFLVIFLFVFFLKSVVLDFFVVSSSSMEPVLQKKDLILVSRLAYYIGFADKLPIFGIEAPANWKARFKSPKAGEIVFFLNTFIALKNYPENYIIKRVKLVPGDLIYYNEGKLGNLNFSKSKPDMFQSEYHSIKIPYKLQNINLNSENIKFYKHIIENEGNKVLIDGDSILINNIITKNYTFTQNHYYLEGDNSYHSFDSRIYGLVPETAIQGKALFIFWSGSSAKTSFFDRFISWIE